jgi:hypothetical protein
MKTCEVVELKLHISLIPALDGGERSTLRTVCFSPEKELLAPKDRRMDGW